MSNWLITAVHNRSGDRVRNGNSGESGDANTIYLSTIVTTIWRHWGMLHPEAHDVMGRVRHEPSHCRGPECQGNTARENANVSP